MDKLAQAQTRKSEAANKILQLRQLFTDNGDKWKSNEQREEWTKASAAYEVAKREVEVLQGVSGVHERLRSRNQILLGDADPLDDGQARQTGEPIDQLVATWWRKRSSKILAIGRPKLGPSTARQAFPHGFERRALSGITGSAGGYTIPDGFVPRLEQNLLRYGPILMTSEIMQTKGGEDMPWPTSDDTTNEGELIGESAEVGGADGSADPTFAAVVFGAYKGSSKMIRVPSELLQDEQVGLAAAIGGMIGERLGRCINRYGTTGTGAGQPTGIVTAATVGVTAASSTAIAADEVLDLIASLDPEYSEGEGVGFMCHQNVRHYLRKLKDGNGRYMWGDPFNVGEPPTLGGFPVYLNNHMASSLTSGAKVLLFGQLNKFKVRLAGKMRLKRLVERYAELDQEAFLGFWRFDTNLLDAGTAPIKYLQLA